MTFILNSNNNNKSLAIANRSRVSCAIRWGHL